MISSLTDLDTQQMLLQKYKKTVRGKAKQIHISFFEEVVEMMENALPAVDLDDSGIGL